MTNTLLATLWKADGKDDRQIAEDVRRALEAGKLTLTGNFRNEPAETWREDDTDER